MANLLPNRESFITVLIQSKLSLRRAYRNWRRRTTQPNTAPKHSALTLTRQSPTSDEDDFRSRPRRPAQLPARSPDNHPMPLPFLLTLLYVISLILRTRKISYPPSVVFDEVHFLKFVRSYYYGNYFFDIHPPLGKLVLLVVTYFFCGQPQHAFDHNGSLYGSHKYVPLRLTSAVFGSAVSPLTYLIGRELGLSSSSCLFAAIVQAVEHMAIIESRLILLDAQLMAWMALCLLLALRMWGQPVHKRWRLVIATALAGAAALSVKWTALTTPALIAIVSLIGTPFACERLAWDEVAVAAGVAITFYTSLFWLHFKMLPNSGRGDMFMRKTFQATLLNNKHYKEGYKGPGFWENFFYLNIEMYLANRGIKDRHTWESKWWQWIINQRGLMFFNEPTDVDDSLNMEKIYVIVNPVVTVITCGALLAFVALAAAWNFRRWRRQIPSKKSIERRRMHACMSRGAFLFAGYVFNLLPYIEVARCTFLYHYLPPLLYALLCTANLIDLIPSLRLQRYVCAFLSIAVVLAFFIWSPWIYAIPISDAAHVRRQIFGKLWQ